MIREPSEMKDGYQNLGLYFGDIHNHCGLSYGHGSFKEAIKNARLQLDFVSITLHAVWPDIPENDRNLEYLVEYHKKGFAKASHNWLDYLQQVNKENRPGQFVIFPSYEWHSNEYGDHCVYHKYPVKNPILQSKTVEILRQELNKLDTPSIIIPHHLGYKRGFRGINWKTFSEELSPVAEIFSFHGASEKSEGPYPYLHSMGPRNSGSCAQFGWSQGHVFGVIGSTDHHNAFPGSYGYGRLGAWATALTRKGIWDAILKRRTYALTGDRIELRFSLNGYPMGAICPSSEKRIIEVYLEGGSTIDYVDVIHNNKVIHRESPFNQMRDSDQFKVYIELGWGEKQKDTNWDVNLRVVGGEIMSVEPRFRGFNSQGNPQRNKYAYMAWEQVNAHQINFQTRTRPNTSLHTPSTEGMSFVVKGNETTTLVAMINGKSYEHTLGELMSGSQTHYLGGFVSPAICFHRSIPQSEYQHQFRFIHQYIPDRRDWYYIRVRQCNNQYAWSSPIWINN